MRSKAPLALIEQIIMLLVFAVAAAVCLRIFAASDNLSKHYSVTDRAYMQAQNAAEQLKNDPACFGENAEGAAQLWFDAQWNRVSAEADAQYCLNVSFEESDNAYLWRANVEVRTRDGELICSLPVAGQADAEVTADE